MPEASHQQIPGASNNNKFGEGIRYKSLFLIMEE